MIFGSVCSGVEAASLAWHPLGWRAAFYSEIEPFPSSVLAHRFADVPNFGDMTNFYDWPNADIDLLVGGTPCQSFSVAGLRNGLDDPRGNLMLTYLAIASRYRPRWLVWENVPGVLSSKGGRDFGTFLGGLAELGYGFAYRVLDAQHFGIPQRRRRVFVVGYLGDWRYPAAVLFERHSLSGNSPPSREEREAATCGTLAGTSPGGGWRIGADEAAAGQIVSTLDTSFGRLQGCSGQDSNHGHSHLIAFGGNNTSGPIDVATALNACASASASGRLDFDSETFVTHSLRADGFDASEDGTGRGTPLVPVAFDCKASGRNGFGIGEVAPTLRAMGHKDTHQNAGGQVAVAFAENSRSELRLESGDGSCTGALSTGGGKPGQGAPTIVSHGVRRLMPRECERLQGMPDDYTLIPIGKNGRNSKDGPRYKAIGNSMAVPCMRWIGERIAAVEDMLQIMRAAA